MTNGQSENEKKPAPDWLTDNITEASKNARQMFFLYIGFLAYSLLTVVGTSDRQIILNGLTNLPIINVDVSLDGFFIICPLVAIFGFIYLQLYLHRLKNLINDLRTNYSSTEKRRLYPWMLNIAEEPDDGFIGVLQRGFSKFALWWLLPIVLIIISTWFVKRHEPELSYIIGLAPIVGTSIVMYFWYFYENSHEGTASKFGSVIQDIRKNCDKSILVISILVFEIFFMAIIIPSSNKGTGWIRADLRYQKLISTPNENDDYKGMPWVNLKDVHLEGAKLHHAILKRANLKNACLQNARLDNANLEDADLWYAKLQNAHLDDANLKGAILWHADFINAELRGANFQGADLRRVKNLKIEQLSEVKTLFGAQLESGFKAQVEKKYPRLLENP